MNLPHNKMFSDLDGGFFKMKTRRILLGITFYITISLLSSIQLLSQTIQISPDSVYVGQIPIGSTSIRDIYIYNLSSKTLDISSISINSDANESYKILNNPGSLYLELLESTTLSVEFSPKQGNEHNAELVILSNAPSSPDVVPLYGVGTNPNDLTFERVFGREDGGHLGNILQFNDNGYILAGSTPNPNEDVDDVWMIETDEYGSTLRSTIYEDEDYNITIAEILYTPDGNYLLFGSIAEQNEDPDYLLMKISSSSFEVIWEKTISGGNRSDYARSMVQTTDGGYLLVGYTENFSDNANQDVYIIKVDDSGNELWFKVIGNSGGDLALKVINTTDSGFAIAGTTNSKGVGGFDAWLIKLDNDGNTLWDKTYGYELNDSANDIAELPSGGYALAGYSTAQPDGAGSKDMFLFTTDASGNKLWEKFYGEKYQDEASNVLVGDDGIIFTGIIEVLKTEFEEFGDLFVVKTDFNGNELWLKQFGGQKNEDAAEMIFNSDGHLVITGSTNSYSKNNSVYFLNLNANGEITDVHDINYQEIPSAMQLQQNYPNPFNPSTTIEYILSQSGHVLIKLYDILGNEVSTLIDENQSAGSHSVEFNNKNLASGVYIYSLRVNGYLLSRKMVLMK